MAATREGRGKRQLLEENDICSARLSGENVRAADRADIRDTCASSSLFWLAQKVQKITEYRDTAPLKPVQSLAHAL